MAAWIAGVLAASASIGPSLFAQVASPPREVRRPANAMATPAASAPAAASSVAGPPERAVVYDDAFRPPAKDMLLPLESDRRADAIAHFVEGILLEDDGDTDRATAAFTKALALDPGNTDLALKQAREYLRRGDTPEAIDALKDTIKANPREPQPYLALASVYSEYLHKTDLALKYANQALDLDPANALSYQYLIQTYEALGQPQKAQQLLDRALKVESGEPTFWLHLGKVYMDLYFKEEQTATPDQIKQAGAIYQKALAAAGDDAVVIEQVASFYAASQQLAEAAPLYEKVLQLDPGNSDAADKLAHCYLVLGQRDKAAVALEMSVKANPNQEAGYELLGEIYREDKQLDKAVDQYEQCLRLNPGKAIYYEKLFEVLLDDHRPERAVEVLTQARQRFPDQPTITERLAIALSEAKQHQQAMTVFEEALLEAQNSQPEMLKDGRFYYFYGAAAEQSGLYEKAAGLLKKALDVGTDPDLIADACNYLGYMWVDRNENLDEAGALIRRALEIRPDSGAFLDSLGWYYYHTNQFEKALAQLQQAAELLGAAGADPVVYEHIGDTYLKLDNSAQALAYWQKAVAMEPIEKEDKERIAKKIEAAKGQMAQRQAAPQPTAAGAGAQ